LSCGFCSRRSILLAGDRSAELGWGMRSLIG
jgi:hypothetical protein